MKTKHPMMRSAIIEEPEEMTLDRTRVCPDCGSEDIERANEEFYCRKCGLVLD